MTSTYTVDELAQATGLSVRTTRYYAGLGLLPPPERRGRVAYYGEDHRARLELVRALQDHGFTLAAIERYFARIPADAGVEDLAVERAMLTSWQAGPHDLLSRRELDLRAGRALTEDQVARLVATGALVRQGHRFEVLPAFEVGVEALDLDVPLDALTAASTAITRHMEALADELTVILREGVIAPFRGVEQSEEDKLRFEQTMTQLRRLTLQAVVTGFQRAANAVISRSLNRR